MDRTDEVGYRAWDEYHTQMQQRFGQGRGRSAYWTHKHYKNFRKIAEICLANDFEVTDYVIRAFDLLTVNHQYLTPKDLTGTELVENYKQHLKKYGYEIQLSHTTQIQQLTDLETRLVPEKYQSEEAILLDINMVFESWFRMLHPENFSEAIFMVYGRLAWSELSESQKLRDYARRKYEKNFQELENRLGHFLSLGGGTA
jgi:hypothetical protein